MSKIEVDAIDKQSGSTLTLGGSGTAVTLASGATQSGFGATGGISWQTTIKTGDFTAVSGEGYFVNTSGGSNITVTLPASPSAGNVVAIKDYARTFGTNKVIVARNGSNMDGTASDTDLITDGLSVTFVFMDSTKGWSFINQDTVSATGALFVTATGGTITTSGNFKIHKFTGPGTFQITCAGNPGGSNSVDYLVAAGGGGGSYGGSGAGGGGGAGGFRASSGAASGCYTAGPGPLTSPVSAISASVASFPITVGGGGAGGPFNNPGNAVVGNNSIFSTITSAGGGLGGGGSGTQNGGTGGSGGGGRADPTGGSSYTAGAGNTPPVSPPQGNNGGTGNNTGSTSSLTYRAGGGGGAAAVGTSVPSPSPAPFPAGAGGAGVTSCITASPVNYSAGGGGGSGKEPSGVDVLGGAAGGPGAGAGGTRTTGNAAPANQGGGGGGGGYAGSNDAGGAGGSGIVIIRYKFQ